MMRSVIAGSGVAGIAMLVLGLRPDLIPPSLAPVLWPGKKLIPAGSLALCFTAGALMTYVGDRIGPRGFPAQLRDAERARTADLGRFQEAIVAAGTAAAEAATSHERQLAHAQRIAADAKEEYRGAIGAKKRLFAVDEKSLELDRLAADRDEWRTTAQWLAVALIDGVETVPKSLHRSVLTTIAGRKLPTYVVKSTDPISAWLDACCAPEEVRDLRRLLLGEGSTGDPDGRRRRAVVTAFLSAATEAEATSRLLSGKAGDSPVVADVRRRLTRLDGVNLAAWVATSRGDTPEAASPPEGDSS